MMVFSFYKFLLQRYNQLQIFLFLIPFCFFVFILLNNHYFSRKTKAFDDNYSSTSEICKTNPLIKNRILLVNVSHLGGAGLGHSFAYMAILVDLAVRYELEVRFAQKIKIGHGINDFHLFFGNISFLNNSSIN